MTTALHAQPIPATAAHYLHTILHTRLAPEAMEWLQQKCCQVQQSTSPSILYAAFSAAARQVGKVPLGLSAAELHEANTVRPQWRPVNWTADQAARCLLLLSCSAAEEERYVSIIRALFSTADTRELVALYQALPLLPYQEQYRLAAKEGVRSNMVNAFHAIALNNPYPFEWFEEAAWNQMVLKVAFIGSPMEEVIGLASRANAGLARMLCDLVHERRAAGRDFPAAVWQQITPFTNPETMASLLEPQHNKSEAGQSTAAPALVEPDTIRILQRIVDPLAEKSAAT